MARHAASCRSFGNRLATRRAISNVAPHSSLIHAVLDHGMPPASGDVDLLQAVAIAARPQVDVQREARVIEPQHLCRLPPAIREQVPGTVPSPRQRILVERLLRAQALEALAPLRKSTVTL